MTDARIGHGSTLELHDGSQFVEIGEVTNISGPNLTRDAIDVTGIGSPDAYKEYIAGLKDSGEITIEMNFVPGSQSDALLHTLFEASGTFQFRITVPSGGSPSGEQWTGSAFITALSPTVPVAEKMAKSVTLKVTGKVTYSAGIDP
jgi:predicted secreted protein